MNLDEVMSELRVEYLESFDEKIQKLEENLMTGNHSDIELEFHKMKGTGQTYGIDEISTLGMVMETICQKFSGHLAENLPKAITLIRKIVTARSQDQSYDLDNDSDFLNLKSIIA